VSSGKRAFTRLEVPPSPFLLASTEYAPGMTALRQSFALCVVLLSLACRTAAPPSAFTPAGLAAVDATVESAIAAEKTPGGVLWMERLGSTYVRAYGDRAVSPAIERTTADTIYDAASLTKPLATAPSVYLLHERRKLAIDDPAKKYLPELADERITIRHLLTHTSGLRPGLDLSLPWSGYEEGIARAAAERPMMTPGMVFIYSDINFILLGEIVRRVTGEGLNAFAAREIYRPLGMPDTGFLPPDRVRLRIAPTQEVDGRILRGIVHDPTSRRMGGVAGHAGLFTTAADVARYARMLFGGGTLDGVRIFAPETVARMTGVETPEQVAVRRAGGWDIDSNYCRPRGAHFPVGSFGHTGWTGGFLWIDPWSETFYIFLSNRVHPEGKGNVITLQYALGTAVAESLAGVDFAAIRGLPPRPGNIRPPPSGETMNGIDALFHDRFAALRGLRAGLITNRTGIDRYGNPTIDLLRAAPGVQLVALFSPEHGIRGDLDTTVGDTVDPSSGLPVYSLYGERRAPSAEQLRGIDALVFDIQDIGARFYTYISTMGMAMEAAAASGVRFVVLDRVNPIGGVHVEGPSRSGPGAFTAWHPIVVRHGMTVGELARMFRDERRIAVDLTVIELRNWKRDLWFDRTGLRWVDPSPNMRSLEAATLYPGVCLLEAAEVSVGRGTAAPFEMFGAPYIDGEVLAAEIARAELPGLTVTPVRFTPQSSMFRDEECGGVELNVTERTAFRPVEAGIVFAAALHRLYPAQFTLEKVDALLRHPPTIAALRAGRPLAEVRALWQEDLDLFLTRRARYLLYLPE
jgi:uncharacterized protein YbbC (DUF1343 family)/CubicO group peptidase (beta-lactamase class C family)